tara:strand:- start:410 stop:1375 length:966 start_codon:yes stop_codon:yes gene_type:complete
MADKKDFVEVNSKDNNDKDVTVFVKRPSTKEYKNSQIEYNKAFREALEGGAILKKKLGEYMRSQGLWDDAKDSEEKKLLTKIADDEGRLKKGGISLSRAKEIALSLRKTRAKFRTLIAERTMLDSNTVEGQADNARFNSLVTLCVLKQDKRTPAFEDLKDYDDQGDQPWAAEAAGELASLIYELDPNYDNTLEENKFLKAYNFANKKNQLVNEDGHPIFLDEEEGEEYLVDENLRFIAYRTDEGYKNQDPEDRYFVNKEGKEVTEEGELVEDDFEPFLDDSGKPVPVPEKETAEETTEETAEVEENTPKKRGRPKKTEEVS